MANEFDALMAGRTPVDRKRRREEEHRIQCACVRWFHLQYPKLLQRLFAVPNGGKRDALTAAKLKAEGVLPGVADIILLKASKGYGALLIELKTDCGRQSMRQRIWQEDVTKDGEYMYIVVRSLEEFISAVNDYLT